ncbi:MAG: TniQ family protein [Caulobacter sp.]|nr:TniQ family protein [Caulobacter sp.]
MLAPPAEVGEALSSWLVRTADAHLLTSRELEKEMHGSIAELDRGNLAPLARLAMMMRTESAALRAMILEDFIRQPCRAGPPPPHCWAVCPYCLAVDVEQGRAPYVRRTWTHPLAVYCALHRAPLVPHGNSDIKIASELTLFGDLQPYEPRDNLLDRSHFDARELILHTIDVLEDSTKVDERDRLTDAVSDIVDALATNMYTPNSGVAIRLIEAPVMRRRSLPGSNELPEKWWLDVNARERLLYVRMALLFLSEPAHPPRSSDKGPFGANWFANRYAKNYVGWVSCAMEDPLLLLATELPRSAVSTMNYRSFAWPKRLRQRWSSAVSAAILWATSAVPAAGGST